jgi:hypothetical protein
MPALDLLTAVTKSQQPLAKHFKIITNSIRMRRLDKAKQDAKWLNDNKKKA